MDSELTLFGIKLKTLTSTQTQAEIDKYSARRISSNIEIDDNEDINPSIKNVNGLELVITNSGPSRYEKLSITTAGGSGSIEIKSPSAYKMAKKSIDTLDTSSFGNLSNIMKRVISLDPALTESSNNDTSAAFRTTFEANHNSSQLDMNEIKNQYSPTKTLNEIDYAALKVGRLVLSKLESGRENSVEALSRFFLDNWLAKNDSSSSKADTLSIQLMCALQKMRAKTVPIDDDFKANSTIIVKQTGAVALECLDRLIEDFGDGNPVLKDIRESLLPLIFLRPIDSELKELSYLFTEKENKLNGETYMSAFTWRENIAAKLEQERLMRLETEDFTGKDNLLAQIKYLSKVNDEINSKLGEKNSLLFKLKVKLDKMIVEHASALHEKDLILKEKENSFSVATIAFDQKIEMLNGRIGTLEQEILGMRNEVEKLLEEHSELGNMEIEEHSVPMIMKILLSRLKTEEEKNEYLLAHGLEKSNAVIMNLMSIAEDSSTLTNRLSNFVGTSPHTPDVFLLSWAQTACDEIKFLNELRMQRDELFEMKLKSLHKVYTLAQQQGEDGDLATNYELMVEAMQHELGDVQENLMGKEMIIQRNIAEMKLLHSEIHELKTSNTTLDTELTRVREYVGFSLSTGEQNVKRPEEFVAEIRDLQDELARVIDQVAHANSSNAGLQNEILRLQNAFRVEKSELTDKIDHLDEMNREIRQAQMKYADEAESARQNVVKLSCENIDLVSALEKSKLLLNDQVASKKLVDGDIERWNSANQLLKSQLDNRAGDLLALERLVASRDDSIVTLQRELESSREQNAGVLMKVDMLVEKLTEAEADHADLLQLYQTKSDQVIELTTRQQEDLVRISKLMEVVQQKLGTNIPKQSAVTSSGQAIMAAGSEPVSSKRDFTSLRRGSKTPSLESLPSMARIEQDFEELIARVESSQLVVAAVSTAVGDVTEGENTTSQASKLEDAKAAVGPLSSISRPVSAIQQQQQQLTTPKHYDSSLMEQKVHELQLILREKENELVFLRSQLKNMSMAGMENFQPDLVEYLEKANNVDVDRMEYFNRVVASLPPSPRDELSSSHQIASEVAVPDANAFHELMVENISLKAELSYRLAARGVNSSNIDGAAFQAGDPIMSVSEEHLAMVKESNDNKLHKFTSILSELQNPTADGSDSGEKLRIAIEIVSEEVNKLGRENIRIESLIDRQRQSSPSHQINLDTEVKGDGNAENISHAAAVFSRQHSPGPGNDHNKATVVTETVVDEGSVGSAVSGHSPQQSPRRRLSASTAEGAVVVRRRSSIKRVISRAESSEKEKDKEHSAMSHAIEKQLSKLRDQVDSLQLEKAGLKRQLIDAEASVKVLTLKTKKDAARIAKLEVDSRHSSTNSPKSARRQQVSSAETTQRKLELDERRKELQAHSSSGAGSGGRLSRASSAEEQAGGTGTGASRDRHASVNRSLSRSVSSDRAFSSVDSSDSASSTKIGILPPHHRMSLPANTIHHDAATAASTGATGATVSTDETKKRYVHRRGSTGGLPSIKENLLIKSTIAAVSSESHPLVADSIGDFPLTADGLHHQHQFGDMTDSAPMTPAGPQLQQAVAGSPFHSRASSPDTGAVATSHRPFSSGQRPVSPNDRLGTIYNSPNQGASSGHHRHHNHHQTASNTPQQDPGHDSSPGNNENMADTRSDEGKDSAKLSADIIAHYRRRENITSTPTDLQSMEEELQVIKMENAELRSEIYKVNHDSIRKRHTKDSDVELLNARIKTMQSSLTDAINASLRKDDELKRLILELKGLRAGVDPARRGETPPPTGSGRSSPNKRSQQKSNQHESKDATGGYDGLEEPMLESVTNAIQFLRQVCDEYKHVQKKGTMVEDSTEFRLPKIVPNVGNKSFQYILEHEAIRNLANTRRERAAEILRSDTDGWDSTEAVALASLEEDVIANALDSYQTVPGPPVFKSPEEYVRTLTKAAEDIAELLMARSIRNEYNDDAGTGNPGLIIANKSDIEYYTKRLELGIHKHLGQIKILEKQREYIQINYHNGSKIVIDHVVKKLPSITDESLVSASTEIKEALLHRESVRVAPPQFPTKKRKTHKHLIDFTPLARK